MRKIFLCAVPVNAAAAQREKTIRTMPPLRRERYDSARSDVLRLQLLAAQAALDGALRAFFPDYTPPAEFFYLPDGRPAVNGVHVSIAHTGSMAVCAAASGPVGVDVEAQDRFIRPEMARRVLRYGEENPRGLLGAWVDKEAFLKLTGEGISGGMQNYAAGESEIFDAAENRRAFIRRIDIQNHLISVCCGEKFEIEVV